MSRLISDWKQMSRLISDWKQTAENRLDHALYVIVKAREARLLALGLAMG